MNLYWTLFKIIAPMLVALAAVWYIDHLKGYQEKYEAEHTMRLNLERDMQQQYKDLTSKADTITRKYNDLQHLNAGMADDNAQMNKERILLAKELASIKLDRRTVQLFNGTTSASSQANPPAETKQGDDGKADSTTAATLQELLIVANENRTNHLKCVNQVELWISFWEDVEEQYNAQIR